MPVEAKPLFRPDALRPHLTDYKLPQRAIEYRPRIHHFASLLSSEAGGKQKEKEILPLFLTEIFQGVLGYTSPVDVPGRYTMSREKHVGAEGEFVDAAIGDFRPGETRFVVAVEGKGPKDPLDRPYVGRAKSAVDQGYDYAINLPCDWIIVTSMRQTRLYYKGAPKDTYEVFDLERLATDDASFRKFVFLLWAENVCPLEGKCHLYQLLHDSQRIGRDLTHDYYTRYAAMRRDIFGRLIASNPSIRPQSVLSATQKMLDRVLFCAFAEDRNLLPQETIKSAYQHADPYNPRPVWDNFRGLFRSINEGSARLKIPQYNGGLFAPDAILDSLAVPDEVCAHFAELASYNYRSPQDSDALANESATRPLVDVAILGHIFEQSISDLDRIRLEIEGKALPETKAKNPTRRKKEGAYYTPAYITRYIVEQALGGVFAERFEELRQKHADQAPGAAAKTSLADPRVYDLTTLNKSPRAALVRFWEAWEDELKTIRVLDPACGSGAFLLEAFDQLHAAYEHCNARLEELRGHPTLFDLNRQILQSNLYGVDLTEEAAEICALSLWIKTAERGKVLTNLDHTLRTGNSVVEDPAVHPRAFRWREAFADVFESSGGFDVIVGNPPYIRQEYIAQYKEYWGKSFESFHAAADIFTYFYELGVKLLRPRGRLGFITSGSWVRGNFGAPLRKFLATRAKVESMIDFGEFQPFEDAEMIRPTILVVSKRDPNGHLRVFKWLTKGKPPENLTEAIKLAPLVDAATLSKDAWNLEAKSVADIRSKLEQAPQRLGSYSRIYRGVLTGLTDAYVVPTATRDALVASSPECASCLNPFLRGQDLAPWMNTWEGLWLITLPSSSDHNWPWSGMEDDRAEACFASSFPSLHAHLSQFRDAAMKRDDQGRYWWELRPCAYWDQFPKPKIMWPDISKLPRFSADTKGRYVGNTGYLIPAADYYLLGVLSSWATWFYISKTAQMLRLRGDRWQYRLFTQYMENIPVPDASSTDREAIGDFAKVCSELAPDRYEIEQAVRHRLVSSFRPSTGKEAAASLNNKATDWWSQPFTDLGQAVQSSFRLELNPFKNPRAADEWEPYLTEKRNRREQLSRELAAAEGELNDRVYQLFHLSSDEIKLLKEEVEH